MKNKEKQELLEKIDSLTNNNTALQFAYTELKAKYDKVAWVNGATKFVSFLEYSKLEAKYHKECFKNRKQEKSIVRLESAEKILKNRNEKLEQLIHELRGYKGPIVLDRTHSYSQEE